MSKGKLSTLRPPARRQELGSLSFPLGNGSRRRSLLTAVILVALLFALLLRRASRASAAHAATGAAVLAGAGVHGFVDKAGPLDPLQWQVAFKDHRLNRTAAWLSKRKDVLAAGQPPPPLQLLSACQVLVNHLYRVVYLRHAKTASSSLLCHFRGCREGEAAAANATLSFEPLQMLTGQELGDLWSSYFVVTFVRSSYQRAVSSYRMMMRNMSPATRPGYGWNDFCADPAGFADVCMEDPRCSKKGADFVWDHIQPQSDCLLTAGGGWAVDFIGRTEGIDDDLAAVLDELERRRPSDAPPIRPLEKSLENVNGRGCQEAAKHRVAKEQYCDPAAYFKGQHAACFDAVQRQYGADVQRLQFVAPAAQGQHAAAAGGRRAAGDAGRREGLP